jgi:hypothetical protein
LTYLKRLDSGLGQIAANRTGEGDMTMSARPGKRKLPHLFKPARLGRWSAPNSIKHDACCVSNYDTRDGCITPRKLARTRVIAAALRKSNRELLTEFEWMADELHGCGDALLPRGIGAAIREGFRLEARC